MTTKTLTLALPRFQKYSRDPIKRMIQELDWNKVGGRAHLKMALDFISYKLDKDIDLGPRLSLKGLSEDENIFISLYVSKKIPFSFLNQKLFRRITNRHGMPEMEYDIEKIIAQEEKTKRANTYVCRKIRVPVFGARGREIR